MSGTAENSSRIKSAASLLLKGGTLVSEQCEKCGGVQVRFADKVTCINCGNESQPGTAAKKEERPRPAGMDSVAATIEAKVSALAQELQNEQDTAVQKQKAELLETYLRILEKLRSLGKQ